MSNAPAADLQLLREPVGVGSTLDKLAELLQSVASSSGPGSGVPLTAACHSALDGKRLREFVHAACAWNQVM
jgi:hypothetical protein